MDKQKLFEEIKLASYIDELNKIAAISPEIQSIVRNAENRARSALGSGRIAEMRKLTGHPVKTGEMIKQAVKNQVAAYAIKGGVTGAGIGSAAGGVIAYKVLKNTPSKVRAPAAIASAIAGAIAGSSLGGRIGAFEGGGIKGTTHML